MLMSYWTKWKTSPSCRPRRHAGEGMVVICVCFANEGWSSRDDGTMVIFDIQGNIP